MPNPFFRFKQFTVYHDRCAMKVTTDACLFGAWTAEAIHNELANSKNRMLDIGTGTGLLSLMVAQKNSGIIDAVEIEKAAAEQAKDNVNASPWKESIKVINVDITEWKPEALYDVIFANPPFYERELKSESTTKNIAHHDGGLSIAALFHFINMNLEKEGSFFLLLPTKRKEEIATLLERHNLHIEKWVLVQQTLLHQPFRLMVQGRLQKTNEMTESILAVKDNEDAYTKEFTSLLQPYYLYL
ncbi:MAG: methyltransferase domain-containing protein [Chitinophagaceae bacterium]|nr:MAG: methyltransferase domain-containing protein [Chitinophagaceae bacterium]